MKQENYHSSIHADISPKEAFDNINHVSGWWTENIEGNSEKLDDVFTVHFGETFVTFTIIESIPCKKIVWLVTDCHIPWLKDKKEWSNTKISWEISTENNLTKIDMTHVGLVPDIECYTNCEKGWNHYIQDSLFKLITEHEGLPQRKKELA
jgi:hypothetical protein